MDPSKGETVHLFWGLVVWGLGLGVLGFWGGSLMRGVQVGSLVFMIYSPP